MKNVIVLKLEWMEAIMLLDPEDQVQIYTNIYLFNLGQKCLMNLESKAALVVCKLIFGQAMYEDQRAKNQADKI